MRFLCAVSAIVLVAAGASAEPSLSVSWAETFTTGGATVYIRSWETSIGCYGACDPPRVFFGGVESPSVTVLGPDRVSAVTPPYPNEEIVAVTVVTPHQTIVSHGQFAYQHDRIPVLIPLSGDALQGRSTTWSTELWVHNDTDADVSLQAKICSGLGGLFYCGRDPLVVAPHASRRLPAFPRGWRTEGAWLYVPRDAAPHISFDLRVKNSQQDDTAVPVVRAPEPQDKLVLLNVPADPAYRKLLRVYLHGGIVQVQVYDMDSGQRLSGEILELNLPTDGSGPPAGALALSSTAVFEAPAVQQASRLRVEITPVWGRGPLWAMVSATHNVSQRVTIIVPQ